jgi:MgtE intracellular N domain
MADERDALRDWHRLFGLLLTDFFTNSPFIVDIERDLSQQQQFLDVLILRRGRGRFHGRLPDGLDDLAAHNLITFKSLQEALDAWAIKELIGHYVAYRKLVSSSPSELLPEDRFRLYAVCARFPHNLSGQVPWQQQQAGVYHCRWGTDEVRVIVAGELPREAHNAPLHLFSASPALVGFGQSAYQQRSEKTSLLLRQLFERFQGEGLVMPYTWEDFERDYFMEHFPKLTPKQQQEFLQSLPAEKYQEMLESLPPDKYGEFLESLPPEQQQQVLQSLPPEKRLAGLSAEQIRQYLDQLTAGRPTAPRKPRRKK